MVGLCLGGIYFHLTNRSPFERDDVNDRTLREILSRYGQPATEVLFSFPDQMYEYRSGLWQVLKDYDTVSVKELKWERPFARTLVVWFVKRDDQWMSIDNVDWGRNTVF
jgi:hypothetical protein